MKNTTAIYLPINPGGEPLTPERLRSFSGCEHYSNEEAEAAIASLTMLAHVIIQSCRSTISNTGNRQAIPLNPEDQSKNKAA